MGRIDERRQELAAAARFRRAQELQEREKQQAGSEVAEALMLDQRRDFLRATDRVFFERIIEGSDLLPIRYLEIGRMAARAVGRLQVPSLHGSGTGFATGFLIAPGLLMTNQHVLRTAEWAEASTLTLDAEDAVTGLPLPPRVFRLTPEDLFVADQQLDFAITSVAARGIDGTRLSDYGFLRLFGQTGKITRDEYATIIQHPNGRQKHVAARNNAIQVYLYPTTVGGTTPEADFLYYDTDTLPGSSGSPVFSDQWYVVALHRRGVPATRMVKGQLAVLRRDNRVARPDDGPDDVQYISNEGTRVSRILACLGAVAADPADNRSAQARRALNVITAAAGEVSDGPVATPVAVPELLREGRARGGRVGRLPNVRGLAAPQLVAEGLEIVRRPLSAFVAAAGYDSAFLGAQFDIPLPRPNARLLRALARRIDAPDAYLLPFRHFTTAMHARRRLPVFAAVNIDGSQRPQGSLGGRPSWSFDPRIAEEHQPDDTIFSQMLQRGHMAARDYVVWGRTAAERREADVHSFTLTNVCPQIAAFNGSREWYEVEREVVGDARAEGARITEFVGPILMASDPTYDSRRGSRSTAEWHTRIRIPLRFWKIIAWVEGSVLMHRAFILDQSDELDVAGDLEVDIERPDGVTESSVEEIAELTDLVLKGF